MTNINLIPDWLAHRAGLAPGRAALIADDTTWTFAELDRHASAFARRLAALGVRPGNRVALLLRNSPEFVALVHAAPRLRITLAPLNMRLAAPEIAWQIADAGIHALLYDSENAELAGAAVSQLDVPPQTIALSDLAALPEAEFELYSAIDLAASFTIIYTSGTTGQPKGALLSYGNYWWSAIGSALNLGLHANDRWLAVLPLFHVGGLSIIIRAAIYNIPMVLHRAFDPAAVNHAIDHNGVTIASVVSTMLQRMLAERGSRPYPRSMRCILLGGGPAPRPLLEECAALEIPVVQTYGLSETASQVATLAPADALRKLGSAGKPLLPTELRIERQGRMAQPGEVGEIAVRGPTVMQGYVNRPDATAALLRDGWLYTGDLGYVDSEGYLYIVSRRTDLIISGGENVYPAEIEAVLLAHPGVEEAAVVGLADPRWGQVPAAAVKLWPNTRVDQQTLLEFCQSRLARYKLPAVLRFVDTLPRNAAGKVMRDAVRALFEIN